MKGSIEWPPSSYVAQVFSSSTGQWEERAYVREDDVTVTVSDVWSDPWAPYSVGNETIVLSSASVQWRVLAGIILPPLSWWFHHEVSTRGSRKFCIICFCSCWIGPNLINILACY
jgi:hypothetical protein